MFKVKLCTVIFLVLLLPSCGWFSNSVDKDVKLRLVNVLGKDEFDDAHIKGSSTVVSLNISLQDLDAQVALWDKTVPVVTYCSNYYCMASGDAAQRLTELGFTDVYAYEAGIAEWYRFSLENKNYHVVGPAQKDYLKMVVKKPNKTHGSFQVISSEDLQKKIKDATILDV